MRRLLDAGHPLTNGAHEHVMKTARENDARLSREAQERGRNLAISLGMEVDP